MNPGLYMFRALTADGMMLIFVLSLRATAWKRVMFPTSLVAVYGMTDEYHQSFVLARDAGSRDPLADRLGGFLAALVIFWRDRSAVSGLQPAAPDGTKRALRAEACAVSAGRDKG